MILMIDNYDSFTYNIVQYIKILGEKVDVITNQHDINKINFDKYDGIVISPGPSNPKNAGISLEIIKNFSHIPMFGICLGMQCMGHVFGGNIIQSKKIMHGKTDIVTHYGGKLFENIPTKFQVVRYHSLVIDKKTLPKCFEIKAISSDGEIMAIKHKNTFMWGVQFHPESYLTDYGEKIIENFLEGLYEYQKNNK